MASLVVSDADKLTTLYKRSQGLANRNTAWELNQETTVTRPAVLADRVFTEPVPTTPPTDLVKQTPWTAGERWKSTSYPHLVQYRNLPLELLAGTSIAATSSKTFTGTVSGSGNLLVNALLPRVSDATPLTATYTISVWSGANEVSLNNYILDRDAGIITILDTDIYNDITTPTITFWRYEGRSLADGVIPTTLVIDKTSADSTMNQVQFRKGRPGTTLRANDELGRVNFYAKDASGAVASFALTGMRSFAEGDASGAIAPAFMEFLTTPSATSTANAVRMRITAAGNVGIGTITPEALLDVSGNANIRSAALIGASNDAGVLRIVNQNGEMYMQPARDDVEWSSAPLNITDMSAHRTYLRIAPDSSAVYVAGGDITTGSSIKYSYDGLTWFNATSGAFTNRCNGVAYSPTLDLWVAVGDGGTSIKYSADGKSWTNGTGSVFSVFGNSVTWADDRFIATGNGSVRYSTDGVAWAIPTTPPSGFTTGNGVAYSPSLNRWIAVGAASTNSSTIAFSNDKGVTWSSTGVTNHFTNGVGVGVVWGLEKFVAVGSGSGNTIKYSSDGLTWVNATNSFTSQGYGVTWTGLEYVAVGSGEATIKWSADGVTWTNATSGGFSSQGQGIHWNSGQYRLVAVGVDASGDATIKVSNDRGRTWRNSTSNAFGTGGINGGYAIGSTNTGSLAETTLYGTTCITAPGSTSTSLVYDISRTDDTLILDSGGTSYNGSVSSILFKTAASNQPLARVAAVDMAVNNGAYKSDLIFQTGYDTRLIDSMRIDSSGRVGIGTSTPAARLDVVNQINVTRASDTSKYLMIQQQASGNDSYIRAVGGGTLYLGAGATNTVGVTTNGISVKGGIFDIDLSQLYPTRSMPLQERYVIYSYDGNLVGLLNNGNAQANVLNTLTVYNPSQLLLDSILPYKNIEITVTGRLDGYTTAVEDNRVYCWINQNTDVKTGFESNQVFTIATTTNGQSCVVNATNKFTFDQGYSSTSTPARILQIGTLSFMRDDGGNTANTFVNKVITPEGNQTGFGALYFFQRNQKTSGNIITSSTNVSIRVIALS